MQFDLSKQQQQLIATARELGKHKFAPRASQYDREAKFPFENYKDLREAGFLKLCVPEEHGGLGADYQTYMLVAAEIGRWCGATALTFNMHTCATMYAGFMLDAYPLTQQQRAEQHKRRQHHFGRIVEEGKLYSQPFSEGGEDWTQRPYATSAKRVDGGWILNGKKIFASLSGAADFHGITCTEVRDDGAAPTFQDTVYLAVDQNSPGFEITGPWDPLGMRGTVSRTLIMKDVFVPEHEQVMPRGTYFDMRKLWPHGFITVNPAYMGIAEAAVDFTIKYLRGEIEGMPPVRRRHYPTKRMAVAQLQIMLEQTRAMYHRVISDARPNPDKEDIIRMYAGHYTVMENSNEICQLAIRTCGGQAMLKSLPLERMYRDSRCGALMLPFTAEICLDRVGYLSLYSMEGFGNLQPPNAD